MKHIIGLLNNYGTIVLPISLILELIALPLPGEAMLTYCGVLVNQGKMSWILSIFLASIGSGYLILFHWWNFRYTIL